MIKMGGWGRRKVILIKQGHFCHFHEVSFGIKFLYGGAGRGYGGEGRIRPSRFLSSHVWVGYLSYELEGIVFSSP